jgi:hypothetical protein
MSSRLRRSIATLCLCGLAAVACTNGAENAEDQASASTSTTSPKSGSDSAPDAASGAGSTGEDGPSHGARVEALLPLVPADARGVAIVNTRALPLDQPLADPALGNLLDTIGSLAAETIVAPPDEIASALLITPSDPAAQPMLLAAGSGVVLTDEGPESGSDSEPGSDSDSDSGGTPSTGPLTPLLAALDGEADLSFIYALEPADDSESTTLASAVAMGGSFNVVDGSLVGSLTFHTPNGADFVAAYNLLNRPATQGEAPIEQPLTLGQSVAGVDQVIVPLPAYRLDAPVEDTVASRNVIKKLFVGMDALDYVNAVADRREPAWLDLVVRSEESPDRRPPAGSVFIRWEFKDDAAVAEFEANELPAGFRLAPTRFLDSDDPDGEVFLALNLYQAEGGAVAGARAEWDVFVQPPDGADPDAGVRPRFAVVQALAEAVSADAANLLTPAEPVSHSLDGGNVVSTVARFDEDGNQVPVFESSFPAPEPGRDPVARFTREMAIGNDYIYWEHGVYDRVLYNATTFNHDAHFVDLSQLTVTDNSRWARYLKPEVKDAVYYRNTLEYVASPMANLIDSEHLDITTDWRDELIRFTTNGHQEGLMLTAVEQLFTGTGDPLIGREISNEIPAGHYHFEITDPAGLEAALDLPPGRRLAPITLYVDDEPRHYLAVALYRFDGAAEGVRAEFSVFTELTDDDGSGPDGASRRPPDRTIIELLSERRTFDPVTIITGPASVEHGLGGDVVTTRVASPTITFDATFTVTGAAERELSLDWIEAGDDTCRLNGVCDRYYYDAEVLDVPVKVPATVDIEQLSTPWNEFIEPAVSAVYFRDNSQEYAIKPWYNLDVVTDSLPFSGVEQPTHTLGGTGTLRGRATGIVDSDYSYSGDARVEDGVLVFALDQQIDNALGTAHIYTTGRFDLDTASGTQTVVGCVGDGLLCSNIESGSTSFYTAQELDPSDLDAISWQINAAVDLGGTFGVADSASTIVATALPGD